MVVFGGGGGTDWEGARENLLWFTEVLVTQVYTFVKTLNGTLRLVHVCCM